MVPCNHNSNILIETNGYAALLSLLVIVSFATPPGATTMSSFVVGFGNADSICPCNTSSANTDSAVSSSTLEYGGDCFCSSATSVVNAPELKEEALANAKGFSGWIVSVESGVAHPLVFCVHEETRIT